MLSSKKTTLHPAQPKTTRSLLEEILADSRDHHSTTNPPRIVFLQNLILSWQLPSAFCAFKMSYSFGQYQTAANTPSIEIRRRLGCPSIGEAVRRRPKTVREIRGNVRGTSLFISPPAPSRPIPAHFALRLSGIERLGQSQDQTILLRRPLGALPPRA
jgi:hypothetical protein